MSEDGNNFEDMLRRMAEELGQSMERAMDEVDLDGIARRIGVDPEQARGWLDNAGSWLQSQIQEHGEPLFRPPGSRPRPDPAPRPGSEQRPADGPAPSGFPTAAPHPLDLPTEEQGVALAALESGRWTLEPGTEALTSHGLGPGPSDALGLVRELRVRDWLAIDGKLTQAGHRALERWLEASTR